MEEISRQVKSLESEMIGDRRYFHSHPESGWFTFFTTAVIAQRMAVLGYDLLMGKDAVVSDKRLGLGSKDDCQEAIKRAKMLLSESQISYLEQMKDGLTGLIATIDTKRPGKCIAFRFDIDGVDVSESKDSDHRPFLDRFASDVDGVSHACGHDGHIAMGLALAKLIVNNIEHLNGKFKFIFQSAEEGTRGAMAMEATGVLSDVDYLLGGHIGFKAKENRSIICGATKLLATTKFDIFLQGVSAHAAGAPEDGSNALLACCQIALNMHGITRHSAGMTRVNVGLLKAGEGRNVIAPNGYLACETRGETSQLNEFMYSKCKDIIQGACKTYGVTFKEVITGGTNGGDSDVEVMQIYKKASEASLFIDNDKIVQEVEFGACDDFAHFMDSIQKNGGKSGYFMIGTKLQAGHHNSKFDFDESCLVAGVDVLLRSVFDLNKIEKEK